MGTDTLGVFVSRRPGAGDSGQFGAETRRGQQYSAGLRVVAVITQIPEFDQGFGLLAVKCFAGKTQIASFVP